MLLIVSSFMFWHTSKVCVYVSLPLLMCAVFYISIQHYFRLSFLSLEILLWFRPNRRLLKKKKKIADENPQNFDIRAIDVVSYDNFCCCCFLLVHSFCSLFMLFAGLKRMLNMPEIDRQNRTEHKITRIIGVLGGSRPRLLWVVCMCIYTEDIFCMWVFCALSLSLALQCNCFKLNIYRPKSE